MKKGLVFGGVVLAVLALCLPAQDSFAAVAKKAGAKTVETSTSAPAPASSSAEDKVPMVMADGVSPLETSAKQVFLLDATTGTPLLGKNADVRMPTSSMSKVLTMYLVFEALKTGKLSLDQNITISEQAWRQEGSRMFVQVGSSVKVEDLVRGVIIQSGNDAAVALAEAVGGSEGSFAAMMNQKALDLGMTQSHFMNATGLPHPDHYSTAHDLAVLAQAMIRDYPQHFHYYSETEFSYGGIRQGNRNPLLYRGIGVDGMKTGHTADAGYGLIATSKRENRRIVLVVNGLDSMQARADESAKILDWGYREYGLYDLVKADEKVADARVFLGVVPTVPLLTTKAVSLTLPHSARQSVQTKVVFEGSLPAPVAKGAVVGKLVVTAKGIDPVEVPLVTGDTVAQLGFWDRLMYKIKHAMGKA